MGVRLAELTGLVGGELRGDGDALITGVSTLASAGPAEVSFLANSRYRKHLAGTRAGAVIIAAEDAGDCPVPCIIVADPYLSYARIAAHLNPVDAPPGIHPSAVVDPSARLGDGVSIGPLCVVGANVEIGAGSRLVAQVTVMHGCRIGARVILHPGAVIGADGFGIANDGGRGSRCRSSVPSISAMIARSAPTRQSTAARSRTPCSKRA
jgi:UDP-3-O-[3-hydroxymyristoyl] glucosamine N-acyltransferase